MGAGALLVQIESVDGRFVTGGLQDVLDELVVTAAVEDHQGRVGDLRGVGRTGLVGVRVGRRFGDDRGDLESVAGDGLRDAAPDVGGRDDADFAVGVGGGAARGEGQGCEGGAQRRRCGSSGTEPSGHAHFFSPDHDSKIVGPGPGPNVIGNRFRFTLAETVQVVSVRGGFQFALTRPNRYRPVMPRSRQPRRQATLASLAAELKVSRTTVSNAYNRPDQLSAELRERVLQAAKRRGYPGPTRSPARCAPAAPVPWPVADRGAQLLLRDPAAMSFLAGLAESCEAAGQGLLLVPAGPGRDDVDAAAVVQQAGVDGFVVYSVATTTPTWPRCGSGTCRPSSATSPGRCRARRSSGSTTGAPCGRSPTTSSRSDTWRSACCACGSVGIARTASCRGNVCTPPTSTSSASGSPASGTRCPTPVWTRRRSRSSNASSTPRSPGTPRPRRPSRSTRRSRHSCAPPTCSRSVRWTGHAARASTFRAECRSPASTGSRRRYAKA